MVGEDEQFFFLECFASDHLSRMIRKDWLHIHPPPKHNWTTGQLDTYLTIVSGTQQRGGSQS